jgi:hypothetical protein
VDGARDDLLAGTALTDDEYVKWLRGRSGYAFADLPNRGALADQTERVGSPEVMNRQL